MSKRILHVVTNVANYDDPDEPTGLWLSELTHAWDHFEAQGYEQVIVSPKGGLSPLEPRALKWPLLDASAKSWLDNPQRMALLSNTKRPDEIDPTLFDAIYFTGGHAVMWDFPDDAGLQALTRAIWEQRHRRFSVPWLLRPAQRHSVGRHPAGGRKGCDRLRLDRGSGGGRRQKGALQCRSGNERAWREL